MSFVTIAIIEKSENREPEENPKAEYLVKLENGTYSFWEFTNKAIGADFQRDLLDKKFEKEFAISLKEQDAKEFSSKEYEGKNSPPATVVRISLSQKGFDDLKYLLSKNDKSAYQWISEKDVFDKEKTWISSQKWILKEAQKALNYKDLPPFSDAFLAKVDQISTAAEEGNLVIFVGAGISKASGVPLWGELIDEMNGGIDIDESEYEVIPQLYYQEHGETNYYKKIGKTLKINTVKPNPIHKEIFQLNPSHIITTNYDDLIEQEQVNSGTNYHAVSSDKDLPKSSSPNLIIKMHGDFHKANVVLKESDYLGYSKNFPLIENIVKGLFASKTVLFIGFSFTDRNLKKIIHQVRHILDRKYNPVLLFNTKDRDKLEPKRLQYFAHQGVSVLGYEGKIEEYLSIKNLKESDKNTDERTARTINFLRFIKEYSSEDPFFVPDMDILDKMYNGLVPFQDLPSIPYNYFVKIKPFAYNDDTPAVYDHFGFHLKTSNEEILRFLKKVEKVEDKTIIYKNENKEEDSEKNEKLHFIFKKLQSSGILCLQRSKDFREKTHNPITLKYNKQEICDCSFCLHERFEFEKAYLKVLSNQLDHNDPNLLIKRARTKYFFGEYFSSYYDLREAASIARKNNTLHLYFIALYNIQRLKYRVKGITNDSVDKDQRNKILREIDNIILPSVIEKLYVNQLSKDILHSIANKELYHNTLHNINKNLSQIEKLYESHKHGRTRFLGPNYVSKMIYRYRVYANFVKINLLFDSMQYELESLTNLFAKGLFTSIATHESLQQKIHFIELYDIDCILKYSNPKVLFNDIQSILVDKGQQLKIDDKGVDRITSLSLAYVNSSIDISSFFRETVSLTPELEYARNKNFIVEQRLRYLFDNILILVSAAKDQFIQHDPFDEVIDKILKYIIASKNQVFSDNKYFKGFIELVVQKNSKSQIDLLLEACISDNMWCEGNIEWFSKALTNFDIDYHIDSEVLLEKIFTRTIKRDSYDLKANSLFPLYKFIAPSLLHLFDEFLENRFDDDEDMMISGLLHNIQYPKSVITPENKFVEICSTEPMFMEFDNKERLSHNQFFRFLHPYIKGQFKLSAKSLEAITSKKNIYSWLVSPKTFDYSKFEIKWIHSVIGSKKLLEYLAKNSKVKLRKIIEKELKESYSSELSEVYWGYFK